MIQASLFLRYMMRFIGSLLKIWMNLVKFNCLNTFLVIGILQASLYKERCSFIPPEPKNAADINLDKDLFYVDSDHKETMIKGDTLLDDQRWVILISTDAHLDIIARAKTLLGDGTFKISRSMPVCDAS